MNVTFSQKDRLGSLETVLGKDTLNLLRFTGTDHVNGLFDYAVEALSTDPNIDFDAILGTHATVTIQSDHGPRHFDGIVTQARWAGAGENGNRYNLTLKPWFWLASRRRNQRIFHEMTVVQIIEKLLSPYAALGKPALKVTLTNSYPTLEYTVQYRESDMAFAMRLMERFGISYHFTHDAGSHSMVLTDSMVSHSPLPGGSRLYKPHDGQDMVHEEHIRLWHSDRRITTGAVRLTDYNFKTPNAAMEVDRVGDAAYAEGQIESYDYPGDYLDQSRGKGLVGLRTEQERGQDQRINALGDCVSLGSGMLLSLSGKEAPKGKHLCLSATHAFTAESYGTGGSQAIDHGYTASYALMPDTTPLAPERTTYIPAVQGPQTAVVVGEGEIDCDQYGRILVHFHWDLEKQYSMRCRVSQNWASKGWGGMVIPRIGMEVVVEFLEGDPDKPLVTGCVYNGKNDTPYPLPDHKTKSVFKTDSHKAAGFNELTFEDAGGQELIYMHGQKDHQIDILNDRAKTIGRDQSEIVGRDKRINIGRDHTENIGRDAVHVVGNDQSLTVGNDRQEHIDGNKAVFIGGQGSLLFGALNGLMTAGSSFMKKHGSAAGAPVGGFAGAVGSMAGAASGLAGLFGKAIPGSGTLNTVIEKFRSDTIGIARTEQIGMFKNTVVGHSQSVSVGKKVSLVVGEDYDIEAKKTLFTRTKKHTQMATEKVVIGGPGGTIIIDNGGVTIKAKSIKLKSPAIDMSSGSPDAAQLQSDKPYNQKCE